MFWRNDEKSKSLREIASAVAEDRLSSAIAQGTLPPDFKGTANDYMQMMYPDTEEAKVIKAVYQPESDDFVDDYFRNRGF